MKTYTLIASICLALVTLTACTVQPNHVFESQLEAHASPINPAPSTEYEPNPESELKSEPKPEPKSEPTPLPQPDYLIAMNASLDWIRTTNTNPQVGSVGGEWAVVALARAGVCDNAWFERYLTSLDTALAGQGGRVERMTDYARVILALTALGLDASSHNGHDLTAALSTFVPYEERPNHSRAINADIFALLALDSRSYDGDREKYIEAILAAQTENGGWGLGGGATPDITAMAIQALAPYYGSNEDIRAAVNRALQLLGSRPMRDAEGNAQVIVALAALGRDAEIYVQTLLTFHDPVSGAFFRGEEPNMMATEQAAYALVAYYRFMTGQNRLYDMSDARGAS